MDKYFEYESKTRKELASLDLGDHKWCLKSYDVNAIGIVKLCC